MIKPCDITQPPQSVAKLTQKRDALISKIASMENAYRRRLVLCVSLIGLITLVGIAGNAYWQWASWGEVVVICFAAVVAVAAALGTAAVAAVVGAAAVLLAVYVDVVGVVGAVYGAVSGVVSGVVGVWLSQQRDRIDNVKTTLAAFADSDKETCLEIREWLADDVIRQYRDQMQDLGRVFTVGEVEAMRTYWRSRAERIEQTKRDAKVEAAYREVYFACEDRSMPNQ